MSQDTNTRDDIDLNPIQIGDTVQVATGSYAGLSGRIIAISQKGIALVQFDNGTTGRINVNAVIREHLL